MLADFLRWWGGNLFDLLPARLRVDRPEGRALIVTPEKDGVSLSVRRAGTETPLAHHGLDAASRPALRRTLARTLRPAPLLLRIPKAALLERDVVLPLAAERELDNVLTYEMDRLTPFAAGDVFWTWSIQRRDRARLRLHLRLLLVPRAAWADILAALQDAGRAADALDASQAGEVLNSGSPTRRIPLVRAMVSLWPRWFVLASLGICLLLAAVVVAMPFAAQAIARDAIEQRILELRPRVAAVERLRAQLAGTSASNDAMATERNRVGDPLTVLAALTDILPDDTWLTDLALHQGRIELAGQSQSAARLIVALSIDPVIRNAAFAAPLTRLDNGRGELFSIRAEIAH